MDIKMNNTKTAPSIRCCKNCEITQPISNFPLNRNKSKNPTYRHRCITCERIYLKDVNKRNYQKRKQRQSVQTLTTL